MNCSRQLLIKPALSYRLSILQICHIGSRYFADPIYRYASNAYDTNVHGTLKDWACQWSLFF